MNYRFRWIRNLDCLGAAGKKDAQEDVVKTIGHWTDQTGGQKYRTDYP